MPTLEVAPKILFCGDTHGPLDEIVATARKFPEHAVIHLGDMSPIGGTLDEVLPIDVASRFWFIPGNHDFDHEIFYDQTLGSNLADRNLHGRVVTINGVRVAGLGGIFMSKIWNPKDGDGKPRYPNRAHALHGCGKLNRWRGGLPRKWQSAIFPEDVDSLSLLTADILVSHEAPSCHRYGFAVLDDMCEAMGCSLVVHGHHHERYKSSIVGGQVRAMGVGYRGITDFDGNVVMYGEYDTVQFDPYAPIEW